MAGCFAPNWKTGCSWVKAKGRDEWELSLADAYLKREDYLRTAIFLQESYVTRQCIKQERDLTDYGVREAVRQEQQSANGQFKQLCYLRNAMAHGLKLENNDTLDALQNEARLRERLRKIRRVLFR